MADDQPDLDLNTVIPLLQKQQNLDKSKAASQAAMGLAGRTFAPNLYDMITNPQKPAPGPLPPPGTVGKVPPQNAEDPRMVPALSEIGMLGAGGVGGKMMGAASTATDLAESALSSAGRNASRFIPDIDQSGLGRTAAGVMMNGPDQAEAAPRLTREQRQEIEKQKQLQENQAASEAAKTKAANEAALAKSQSEAEQSRQNKEAEANLQLKIQAQQRAAAEEQARKEREQPFREAHSTLAKTLPVAGIAGAAGLPYLVGALQKAPLGKFVDKWAQSGQDLEKALKGRTKLPATVAAGKLSENEAQWPNMEKRYTPGMATKTAAAVLPAEGVAFPTEYDFATQGKDSSGRPTTEDIKDTALRAAGAAAMGSGLTKLGSSFVPKVPPYTEGQGLLRAYNKKYPPTKAELKNLPPPPQEKLGSFIQRLTGPK